ncbi:MAG: nitroreductase family protein [Chloroflexi bacterium]|nr:nitroreductase family protein [Chloroflexota bacterium]
MKPRPHFAHPVHELIQKRWSPRAFSAQPVEEDEIMVLLEAARWAASANNEQPWRFIYATQAQTERYGKLFACLSPFNQVWAKTAPVLMMTLVKTHFARNNQPNRWALHDLGLAVGNLTTQASALDLYVHNMGGFSVETARQLFDLPADIEPVTMIAIGYLGDPDQLPETLRERELAQGQRKPIAELVLE